MKKQFLLKTMFLLCALIVGSSSVWADSEYTIGWGSASGDNSKNFDNTSGSVTNILSFSTAANSGSTPQVNSDAKELRLYYNSSGKGGSITITPASGITITGAVMTTSTTPSVKYSVDGGTATSVSQTNKVYTISGITASTSLKIQNVNTTNTQLRILTIKISYIVASPLASIALSGNYPTSFYTGDTFSHEGMTVTATYEDSSTKDVTAKATFTGYDLSTIGNQTVTVSYTDNSVTKTTTYPITVSARPTFTVTFGDDNSSLTEGSAGSGVTLPTRSAVGDYSFAGWTDTDITVETSTAPTILTGTYKPSSNITLYPVYTRSEVSGNPAETKIQTLEYDSWTYGGSTSDKNSYRLFNNGGYLESSAFDLSTLTKVKIWGGTYGGETNNSLTIGDGSNTWKNVTVTTTGGIGEDEFTGGTALSGTKPLRITSTCNGVRISKVEIYAMVTPTVNYYTSHPSGKTTASWSFSPETLETMYVGETADVTLTVTTDYDGTLSALSSSDAIATITKTADKEFSIHAVAKGDATFTISGDETDNYKAISKTISVSVLQKYIVTIETPDGGTLVVKNGENTVNTGDKFLPGTKLSVTATPDAQHNFRNWQALDPTLHNYTASNTGEYTVIENNVTFKANFDAKVYHKVIWSANGVETSEDVEENTAITFPATAETVPGYAFMGWAADAISGSATSAPTYVTEATMGTADVTYYAVYARETGTPVVNHESTFTVQQASAPSSSPYVNDGSSWTWDNITFSTSGQTACMPTNSSISFTLPEGGKAVSLTITRTTSNTWAGACEVVLEDASKNSLNTFSLGSSTSKTYNFTSTYDHSASYTLSNSTSKSAWTKDIVFKYTTGGISYSNYCTTIPAGGVTMGEDQDSEQNYTYATFSADEDVVFTSDVTVFALNTNGEKLEKNELTTGDFLITDQSYNNGVVEGGYYVPAGTGVMLRSTSTSIGYYFAEAQVDPIPEVPTNLLIAGTGTTPVDSDNKYYKLTYKNADKEDLGFYWGATDGAPFLLKKGKAYLVLPKDATARSFLLSDEESGTTGVESVHSSQCTVHSYYNLNGQKVQNPQKGLYIVNGRKVVIK